MGPGTMRLNPATKYGMLDVIFVALFVELKPFNYQNIVLKKELFNIDK